MNLKHLALVLALGCAVGASAAEYREHRGVYLTPYVEDWPTGPINSRNAETHKNILRRNLDRLQANGINVLYFAVRPLCDAAYKSRYEPWSASFSGTRGVAPPFDPLEFVIEECHSRGIEVYTWLNAYRYCTSYKHGESELDYEITHPEWLLVQDHETILNPALEEVKQRVCDVAADIVDNYDIDGFLFDDYYYSNPTPMEVDAEYYEAAKKADDSIGDQLTWRINNVSSMIERVSKTVKSHKPWVVFGIKPAGVASPPNIRDYGLEPSPSNIREQDWQYKAVAADPIYWYSQHYCDFMAPQIYWCDLYTPLQEWWSVASRKFDRHLYSAVSLTKFSDFGSAEYAREAEFGRTTLAANTYGIGFFRWKFYMYNQEKIEGKATDFYAYMGEHAFATPALAPVRPWNNVYAPAYITGLRRDGSTLVWDEVPGMRYVIYAFREGEEQKPFNTNIVQVRYTNSFDIPEALTGLTFGVSVYDRYGNEYSMSTEGASTAEAVVPRLTYPEDGATSCDLFDFVWEPTGCDNVLEVSDAPDFGTVLVQMPTSESSLNSFVLNNMETGKKYYWRVRTSAPNAPVGVSEVRSFTASRVAMTAPTGQEETLTPTLSWTPAFEGADYFVEVSRNAQFSKIDYTAETSETSIVPEAGALLSGHAYWVRVTARRQGHESRSDVMTFATADLHHESPLFITPAYAGAEIHSNESVCIEPIVGTASMVIQISETEDFPTRKRYQLTLRNGASATPGLGSIRIAGKALEDGVTYYVRTASNYFLQESSTKEQQSDFRVSSFVYNATEGVSDAAVDASEIFVDSENMLQLPEAGISVAVYGADGRCVMNIGAADSTVDLNSLATGFYVIRAGIHSLKWMK
ncbi:MAG: family 10 glycosylhydrolase [Muribaculaceae bacterium]|nr:family 10 glycosylhydrolase [Muribaculaceae bacterium]